MTFLPSRYSCVTPPWLFVTLIAVSLSAFCQFALANPERTASPRLQKLLEQIQSGDTAAQDTFWETAKKDGLPLVEPGSSDGLVRMTFLLRSGVDGADPRNIRLAMMIPESPLYSFTPVMDTGLWSVTLEVADAAMGMYWLAWPRGRLGDSEAVFAFPNRDGIHYEFFADPHARQTIQGTISPEFPDRIMSVFFASPDQPLPYSTPRKSRGKGTVQHTTIDSATFAGPREVSVYLPSGYSSQCKYPWTIVFDAEQYLSLMSFATVLDNLIEDKVIPPIAAVLVHTGASRVPDLAPNPSMQGFVRDELIPWARKTYALSEDNQATAVMGFSHGGLAALHAGLKNSDLIGAVVAHSSSAWWSDTLSPPLDLMGPMPPEANGLARIFRDEDKLPLRFYMDVGTWEGRWQVDSNKKLQTVLAGKGYPVIFRTYEGPHDYLAWREMLPGALEETFKHHKSDTDSCQETQ